MAFAALGLARGKARQDDLINRGEAVEKPALAGGAAGCRVADIGRSSRCACGQWAASRTFTSNSPKCRIYLYIPNASEKAERPLGFGIAATIGCPNRFGNLASARINRPDKRFDGMAMARLSRSACSGWAGKPLRRHFAQPVVEVALPRVKFPAPSQRPGHGLHLERRVPLQAKAGSVSSSLRKPARACRCRGRERAASGSRPSAGRCRRCRDSSG